MNKYFKYALFGFPAIIYDALKEDKAVEQTDFLEPETEHIRDIIISAREQGLSEITVEVSKDFAAKLTAGGSIPVEGIIINAEAKAKKTKNGKVTLSLKLNPDNTYQQIEKLARLHKDGILSDEEFSAAKKRLIDKL